ncbi:MAG: TldD/PmbA family protein [Candidatus Bathyarchaeota archaeon]|nr:TldD/PmbA family protein [Candidatus Bathyarchaeota archaeon]MDH5787128.1 TldD/PmbA family protein [Candidatus Bathyarchaeota archaeon]
MKYENLKDELLSAVDSGLKYARTIDGKAEFELYLFYEHATKVKISQGVVDATDGSVEGNAIRVAKDNMVSFASSSGISVERIKRSINEALSSLRAVSIKDERFKGFCKPKRPGKEGVFTKEILNLSEETLINIARDTVKEAQEFDKRIHAVESECSAEWGGFAVGNTNGLQQASRSALNGCEVACIAVKEEERRTAYEFDITRERLIKTSGIGTKAAQKAVSLLDAKKLNKTTVLPTIWVPIAAASYIVASLGQSTSGGSVVEGLSPLGDKIGQEIADSRLTIIDDGQNPTGINTEAIDAEGYPQQKTTIIEKGRIKQFLFDSYYAQIYGTESTGNCTRQTRIFGSSIPYETSPQIQFKNFAVEPGNKNLDALIASIDGQAILIVDIPIGIFHSDVSTGEFSAVAQSAFLVEDCEKKWPLEPVSVSGDFYNGLKQLRDVGGDLEKTVFTVETPTLVFDGFSIVG